MDLIIRDNSKDKPLEAIFEKVTLPTGGTVTGVAARYQGRTIEKIHGQGEDGARMALAAAKKLHSISQNRSPRGIDNPKVIQTEVIITREIRTEYEEKKNWSLFEGLI